MDKNELWKELECLAPEIESLLKEGHGDSAQIDVLAERIRQLVRLEKRMLECPDMLINHLGWSVVDYELRHISANALGLAYGEQT